MRHILALLLVTAVVIGGAWWIEHLVGGVTLHAGPYTVEAPISVAVLAALLFAALLYAIYRIVDAVFGLGRKVRGITSRGARRKGERALTHTLVALAAREGESAKEHIAQARRYLGDSPHVLLLAASAGTMAGDEELATKAFEKLADGREGAFLGLRGLLNMAVAREDWARASELAKRAEKVHPGAAWLRAERSQFAARSGDWQEALLLNRDAAPQAALEAAAAEAERDPVQALKLARDAFKRDPGLPAAALAFARRLREAGKEKAAQDALQKAWARSPNPEIAAMALATAPDRLARLKAAESLVQDAAESAESHMLLGRLALEAGQVPAAQRHAAAAERAGLKQRRLYMLMADIAEALGDDAGNRSAYHEAVKRAADAEPDPEWHCGACGATHAAWHAACPNCHAVGRVRWTSALTEPVA
jgi:HemY protein